MTTGLQEKQITNQVCGRPATTYLPYILTYTYLHSYVHTCKQRLAELSRRMRVKQRISWLFKVCADDGDVVLGGAVTLERGR